jgi:hypothetical protein
MNITSRQNAQRKPAASRKSPTSTLMLLSICTISAFSGGWAVGASQQSWNAATWNAHTKTERLMFTRGYWLGYSRGAFQGSYVTAGLLAEKNKGCGSESGKTDPAILARMQAEVRAQNPLGNRQMDDVAMEEGMNAFYGDPRNQNVCWYDAFKFSAMALNGDTPTEDELDLARKTGAINCK